MTHQSHQTNGASLEDCHTNFFALTDLCGIKWRKFVNNERPNASSDPLDDPILRSYSRCMQADILCVWRRVQSTRQDNSDPSAMFDVNTSKVHPPLSLAAAKELWIFWYGEEPDLTDLVDAELLKVAGNQMMWNGTWERGLTYECRSLLFKALHNLIERFVLTKDIVRFGKWFVQPCTSNERIFGRSSQHLSFSFTFFVHGDTVCASIDLREHPAVRPLTKEHLTEAAAAFAAAASNANSPEQQTSPNSPNAAAAHAAEGIKNENASSNNNNNNNNTSNNNSNNNSSSNNNNNSNSVNPKPRKVILAPFGMAATLTGNSYKTNDPMAEKILDDWASFFPLCNKENSDVPPVVEVIAGGHKMYHPSIYVLVTDLDDMEEMEAAASQKCPLGTSSSAEAAALAALSSANQTTSGGGVSTHNNHNYNDSRKPLMENFSNNKLPTINGTKSSLAHMVERLKIDRSKVQPYYDTQTRNFTCNTTNIHAPPQAACEMPERAWQDCVTNVLHVQHSLNGTILSTSSSSTSLSANTNNSSTSNTTSSNTSTTSAATTTTSMSSSGINSNNNDNATSSEGMDQTDNVSNSVDIKPNTTTLSQKQQHQQIWGFVDPTQKAPCICTNSKSTLTTAVTASSSTSVNIAASGNMGVTPTTSVGLSCLSPSSTSSMAAAVAMRLGSSSMAMALNKTHTFGSSTLHLNHTQQQHQFSGSNSAGAVSHHTRPSTPLSQQQQGDNMKTNSLRIQRIPFHKRHLDITVHDSCDVVDNIDGSQQQQCSTSIRFSNTSIITTSTSQNNNNNSSTNSKNSFSSQFTTSNNTTATTNSTTISSNKSNNPAACYTASFYQSSSCSSDTIPKQRFVLSYLNFSTI
ncbi:mediator of RNA polymerase II transcription subunit 13-like isoform X2 [Lucilia sericata]|uniref:mediator of RNA polymerase II transcription subunit 13-like isoform X2 n=1 Tax=Lucilia sericata TaxID=13632 RepID=UPI0018A867CC|nr:mediator of RNA polymerase II transcription subunit 13-like isoform X2 [Lucilia sericata]